MQRTHQHLNDTYIKPWKKRKSLKSKVFSKFFSKSPMFHLCAAKSHGINKSVLIPLHAGCCREGSHAPTPCSRMRLVVVALLALLSPALAIDLLDQLFGIKDQVLGKVFGLFGKDDCGCPCRDYWVAKCQASDMGRVETMEM